MPTTQLNPYPALILIDLQKGSTVCRCAHPMAEAPENAGLDFAAPPAFEGGAGHMLKSPMAVRSTVRSDRLTCWDVVSAAFEHCVLTKVLS